MAPEILQGSRAYTLSADVYSYGIVLWEIASQAVPWTEINDASFFMDNLLRRILSGQRPQLNAAWPPAYCDLMVQCWATDPALRPVFGVVVEALVSLLQRRVNADFEETLKLKHEERLKDAMSSSQHELSLQPQIQPPSAVVQHDQLQELTSSTEARSDLVDSNLDGHSDLYDITCANAKALNGETYSLGDRDGLDAVASMAYYFMNCVYALFAYLS